MRETENHNTNKKELESRHLFFQLPSERHAHHRSFLVSLLFLGTLVFPSPDFAAFCHHSKSADSKTKLKPPHLFKILFYYM